MSYARLSEDSEVYVWPDPFGDIHCMWCALKKGDATVSCEFIFTSARATISHLREHVAAGHKVPDYAFQGLREDALWLWRKRLVYRLKRAWGANWSTP